MDQQTALLLNGWIDAKKAFIDARIGSNIDVTAKLMYEGELRTLNEMGTLITMLGGENAAPSDGENHS